MIQDYFWPGFAFGALVAALPLVWMWRRTIAVAREIIDRERRIKERVWQVLQQRDAEVFHLRLANWTWRSAWHGRRERDQQEQEQDRADWWKHDIDGGGQ